MKPQKEWSSYSCWKKKNENCSFSSIKRIAPSLLHQFHLLESGQNIIIGKQLFLEKDKGNGSPYIGNNFFCKPMALSDYTSSLFILEM